MFDHLKEIVTLQSTTAIMSELKQSKAMFKAMSDPSSQTAEAGPSELSQLFRATPLQDLCSLHFHMGLCSQNWISHKLL